MFKIFHYYLNLIFDLIQFKLENIIDFKFYIEFLN